METDGGGGGSKVRECSMCLCPVSDKGSCCQDPAGFRDLWQLKSQLLGGLSVLWAWPLLSSLASHPPMCTLDLDYAEYAFTQVVLSA